MCQVLVRLCDRAMRFQTKTHISPSFTKESPVVQWLERRVNLIPRDFSLAWAFSRPAPKPGKSPWERGWASGRSRTEGREFKPLLELGGIFFEVDAISSFYIPYTLWYSSIL